MYFSITLVPYILKRHPCNKTSVTILDVAAFGRNVAACAGWLLAVILLADCGNIAIVSKRSLGFLHTGIGMVCVYCSDFA